MQDKSDEEYKKPEKPKYNLFGGEGNSLAGANTGNYRSSDASSTSISKSSSNNMSSSTTNFVITIDENEPTTNIQIRLANGTRLVQKFNHSHTILDLKMFVSAKCGQNLGEFRLLTTFPSKELLEDGLSLKDAKLLNTSIVQR